MDRTIVIASEDVEEVILLLSSSIAFAKGTIQSNQVLATAYHDRPSGQAAVGIIETAKRRIALLQGLLMQLED